MTLNDKKYFQPLNVYLNLGGDPTHALCPYVGKIDDTKFTN